MDKLNEIKIRIEEICKNANDAVRVLSNLPESKKNALLKKAAEVINDRRNVIKEANQIDIKMAENMGKSKAFIDRLLLTDKRIDGMIDGLKTVINLPDPVGRILKKWSLPNGLEINKVSVPIGVIGVIYESRPNVTCEAASLCFKSGNAVILKGGKESFESNSAIEECFKVALREEKLPEASIQLVPYKEREAVSELLKMDAYVNLIIPRGGEGLIRYVAENSLIPVIKHYKGVCHIYVDKSADFDMAEKIILNAKVQRPGVCNAVETLLVHKDIANDFLPKIADALKRNGVAIRGCLKTLEIVDDIQKAVEDDWYAEYLDLILAVKVVENIDEAINHITKYGSKHSDAIISNDNTASAKFVSNVDSAAVFVNCSTRFHDGGQFGFGAEIGISTDKIHARGPMALEELNIYKYIVKGNGQIRE